MLTRNILLYGKTSHCPRSAPCALGRSRWFMKSGDLRYIRHGAHEVLRRVYVAVRDRNWGTVPPQIENEHIEDNGDSFASPTT
jgi:hypothetical protein